MTTNTKPIYDFDNYLNEFKARMRFSLNKACEYLKLTKDIRKTRYDRNKNISNFAVGDLVLIKYETRRKNQCHTHGPYKIINTQNENYIFEVNGKLKKYHNNTLKLFKKN